MENQEFLEKVSQNKQEINTILEIDELKKENKQMLKLLKKIFKADENSEQYDKLKADNKALKEQLNTTIQEYHSKLQKEQTLLSKANKDIKNLNTQIDQLQQIQQNDILQKLNGIFDTLEDSTKSGVQNILKSTQKTSILISGILHIDALWHYCAYLRNEHKDSEFDKLKQIVTILLDEYKAIGQISLQDIKVGDEFDSEIHTRDNRSEQMDGTISEVILQGYLRDDEIVKKSIVKVV